VPAAFAGARENPGDQDETMSRELEQAVPADVDRRSVRRATLLFVRMWAIAHILHLIIANRAALDTPWNIAVVVLALAVILRPESGRLVAAMAVAQLVEYAVEMPFSPDHWALVSLVNLAILFTMAASRSLETTAVARSFPAIRVLLLTAYGAAALSKWNTTFLDPTSSCANMVAKVASLGLVGPLGDSSLVSIAAALTETTVFVLLATPWARSWGVMLGLTFHFTLSASPAMMVGDFTSTVFALFLLFLRPDVTDRVLDRLAGWAAKSRIARDARRRPPVTAVLAFVVVGSSGYLSLAAAMATLYVLVQIYFVAMLLATAVTLRSTRAATPLGRVRWMQVPVLALAVLWALNPYLGLRTTGSFTMFSNLRTEAPHPNHLFMPSWRLTTWQDDMVTLDASSDTAARTGVDGEVTLPLVSLRRLATLDPDMQVSGTIDGRSVTWGPGDDQELLEPLPWWQYKLFFLRPVESDGRPYCSSS
jgi:hypothetical protein